MKKHDLLINVVSIIDSYQPKKIQKAFPKWTKEAQLTIDRVTSYYVIIDLIIVCYRYGATRQILYDIKAHLLY